MAWLKPHYHLLALPKHFLHLHTSGMNCLYTYCTFKETHVYCMSGRDTARMDIFWVMIIGGYFWPLHTSHMINCAFTYCLLNSCSNCQCSPVCIVMGMMPVGRSPWGQLKTGIRDQNNFLCDYFHGVEVNVFVVFAITNPFLILWNWFFDWHNHRNDDILVTNSRGFYFFSQWNACANGNSNVS